MRLNHWFACAVSNGSVTVTFCQVHRIALELAWSPLPKPTLHVMPATNAFPIPSRSPAPFEETAQTIRYVRDHGPRRYLPPPTQPLDESGLSSHKPLPSGSAPSNGKPVRRPPWLPARSSGHGTN